jgi:predicted DNA-binding protein (UPF0251 family)
MLKKKQYEAIQLLVYSDMKHSEIEEELNVSHSTFWRWQKDEEFCAELEKENRKKFKSLQIQALKTMESLMTKGHFQATKYILDGNDYAPTEKHELDMSANITVDYGDDDEG